jgi:hypothetical protein
MADYLANLINDKPTLFIIVGIILLAMAIGVKFSGKLEIAPNRQKLAGVAGVIFLSVGLFATYYPSGITVYGQVKNWEDAPLPNGSIQIGSIADITDFEGKYVLAGVPRESTDLTLKWRGRTINKSIILPKEKDKKDVEVPIKLNCLPVEISGTVYNESGKPEENAKVSIQDAGTATTDSDGYYIINNILCNVIKPINLNVSVEEKLRYRMQNLFLSEEEIESGQKTIDVNLPNRLTISINGIVSYYNTSHREPIPGAIVDIDGTKGTSDSEGNYEIPYVSREATSYNVTLNGNLIKSGKLDAKLNQAEYRYKRTYKQMVNVPAY